MPTQSFRTNKHIMSKGVLIFDVFPGIHESDFTEKIFDTANFKGAVIRSYGAGNIPTNKKFLDSFRKAVDEKNAVLVVVTQCSSGSVELCLYETSAKLLELGMVSGLDMTTEAALCKLMVLFGKEDLRNNPEEIARLMQISIVGEQSRSIFVADFKNGDNRVNSEKRTARLAPKGSLPTKLSGEGWNGDDIDIAILRFSGAKVESGNPEKTLTLKVFVDLSSDDGLDDKSINYAGQFRRLSNHEGESSIYTFGVTEAAREFLHSGKKVSFTIHLSDEFGSFSWEKAEIAVYVKESKE